ncbi:MAG: hypothetical protein ACFFD4_04175 [Candidatus Odinarchaeota archaeon]
MTFVKKFGFKKYDGEYRGMVYRVWSLMLFDMTERIWKQRSVLLAYAILCGMILVVAVPILAVLAVIRQMWDQFGVISSVWGQSFYYEDFPVGAADVYPLFVNSFSTYFLTILFLGVAGGKVLSQDIETKVIQNYFTRISREEYFIGKFLAVFISYFLSLEIPFTIIYFWMCSVLKIDAFNFANLDIYLKTLIFVAYACLFYTGLTLAVSSGTARRFYATLVFVVLLTGVTIVPNIFYGMTGNEEFLIFDMLRDLRAIYMSLIGYGTISDILNLAIIFSGYESIINKEVAPPDALLFITGLTAILMAYALKKTILDEE